MNELSEIELQTFQEYDELMKKIHDKLSKRNERILLIIEKLKGKEFVKDLVVALEESESDGTLNFVRVTTGKYQEEDYELIKGMWVDQYCNGGFTGDTFAGYCYIELKPNRYLKFHYSM